jgi:hypothetical protein
LIHNSRLLGGRDRVEETLQDIGLIGKGLVLVLCIVFSITDRFTGNLLQGLHYSLEGGQLGTHWCGNEVQGNVNELQEERPGNRQRLWRDVRHHLANVALVHQLVVGGLNSKVHISQIVVNVDPGLSDEADLWDLAERVADSGTDSASQAD